MKFFDDQLSLPSCDSAGRCEILIKPWKWEVLKLPFFFLRFSFLLQLITPKFPVVVKVGHANGGYGKVSLFLKRTDKN